MAASTSHRYSLRELWIAGFALLIAALYLTNLTTLGMYSTDEPRYADIGRTMAHTGDWITPRLWGEPWFEKPPLLYWMTAVGFKLGLSDDLAPRLPLALFSLAFLAVFRWRIARVFNRETANFATAMLATSAGWLAYTHVAVTDLPLTAFFTLAVLFAMPADEGSREPSRVLAAISLALAVLAKSGPPMVLFLPVLVMDWRNWRSWFVSWPVVVFLAIAVPWHIVAAMRNGSHFLYVLFVEQQFGRFFNSSRQHEQPWWFYAPFFLLLLFPWFPLLLSIRGAWRDDRTRMLAIVAIFGLLFFSASVNKLPGYVLPLVPVTCVLMGSSLAHRASRQWWLIAPLALLGLLPIAAQGLRSSLFPLARGGMGLAAAGIAGAILAALLRNRIFPAAVVLTAGCFLWLETSLLPALDRTASGRSVWAASHPTCSPVLPRGLLYGVYYYSGKALPDCAIVDKNPAQFGGDEPTK